MHNSFPLLKEKRYSDKDGPTNEEAQDRLPDDDDDSPADQGAPPDEKKPEAEDDDDGKTGKEKGDKDDDKDDDTDRKEYRAGNCNDCNRQFCLDYNLPICKGAGMEDVFTTCFREFASCHVVGSVRLSFVGMVEEG